MLIAILIIAGLFITANLIYVTPAINIENEPLPISRPTDVKKLRELEQLTATGWANGNGAQVASAFTEKADFVTFNGEWYKSRQEIEKSHQKLFDGVLKGSTIENRNIKSIRFLNSTTAIVHVTGAIKQKWRKKPAASRMSIQTLVAVMDGNEKWNFTAFHNGRIRRFTLWDGIVMSLT